MFNLMEMLIFCDIMSIFSNFNFQKWFVAKKYLLYAVIFELAFFFVQGSVQFCHNVQSPLHTKDTENCSLVCSLKIQHAVSGVDNEEIALCMKNTSFAVSCNSHADCRQRHVGAYCKEIPCLCKVRQGSSESFIIDPSIKIPKLNTCVVPSKHMNPDLPIVPFPWRTLLIVVGLVFMCATCMICGRWLTPILRSMKAKRSARGNPERREQSSEDNANLFSSAPQQNEFASTPFTYYFPRGVPHIYRANPRCSQHSHRSSRARYAACAQAEGTGTLSNQDKPPPYETAIQLPPPAYEDVERAILESNADEDFGEIGRVIVHPVPTTIVPLATSSAS